MADPEFCVDGGGVYNDQPLDLPPGSWIRVRIIPGRPDRDLRIEVRSGALHVWGIWHELETIHSEPNAVVVWTR